MQYDAFFKSSEKMVFPKKSHSSVIFPAVLSGKMIFLFPENMILLFRQKNKDDISQTKRWSFQIKSRWNMIFHVLSAKMVFFFSGKYNIFSLGGK